MTKAEIIAKFHLFMDDSSDLSSSEESDLFDKIYQKVCMDRPWEFLKKAYTGTLSGLTITLPSDFSYLVSNANHTDESWYAERPVVFSGSNYTPLPVVSWSDRRQYINQNVCYVDVVNGNLVFANQPPSSSIEYDYCSVPANLTSGQSPIFPARFHDVIYHGMCVDDFIIQQSEKARSYAEENQAKYQSYMTDMAFWNSNLIQM